MRELKTKEAIFRAVPDFNKDDTDEMNRQFIPYLFFKDHRDKGYRECWCSSCQEHYNYDFIQRTETPEHHEFIITNHNEKTKCPHCGRILTAKETYKAKQCLNLSEWRNFVFVKPKGKNAVFLMCGYAYKKYKDKNYLAMPICNITAIYYITPGFVKMYQKRYWTPNIISAENFYDSESIKEPLQSSYSWIGFERLKNTFLEYAPLDLFRDAYKSWSYKLCPEVKFLTYYELYPNVEKLLKIDLGDFVCNLIDGKPMKRDIDWYAPTPKQMFGMCKAEFDDFRKNFYGMTDFRVYQILRKAKKGFTYSQAREIIEQYDYEASLRLARAVKRYRLNLTHTLNYLVKNTKKRKTDFDYQQALKRTAIMWTDYITFASELKYDLKRDDVIYPKKLNEAHDNASRAVTVKKDEIAFEKYKKRYEKLQNLYEYSNGTYSIVIPQGINDIIDEGKILCHCVGGYAERHVSGKTTILFMRKCSAPEERLVTIEIADGQKYIRQNYGYKNRHVTKEEQAFIDSWLAWVKAGSKRNKKKKAAKGAA